MTPRKEERVAAHKAPHQGQRGVGEKTTEPKTSHESAENSVKSCNICKKQNHETRDCFFRCKKCKIQNHSAQKCWFRKKEEEAKYTETETDKYVFTCQKTSSIPDTYLWFIDSGCSSHMSSCREYFTFLDEECKSEVILGDGKKKAIESKGTISVELP